MRRATNGKFTRPRHRHAPDVAAMLDEIRGVLNRTIEVEPDYVATLVIFALEHAAIRARVFRVLDPDAETQTPARPAQQPSAPAAPIAAPEPEPIAAAPDPYAHYLPSVARDLKRISAWALSESEFRDGCRSEGLPLDCLWVPSGDIDQRFRDRQLAGLARAEKRR